jgi:hypothetical protein
MKAFVVEENRNSQAGIFLYPLLHGVGELGHGARPALFAGARHFTETVLHKNCGALGKKSTFPIHKHGLWVFEELRVLPGAFELRELFFEGHAREQVSDALVNIELWVAIGRRALRQGTRRGQGANGEQKESGRGEEGGSRYGAHSRLQKKSESLQSKKQVVLYHRR